MKIAQFFTQKVKVAALLLLIMAFVILFSLRVDNRAHNMDEAVTSVYQDRLQPALIIVYLSENLHAKRMLLENHINGYSQTSAAEIETQVKEFNAKNDKLIADFEQTLLTRNEADVLAEFKSDLTANARMELMALRQSDDEVGKSATASYSRDSERVFRQSIQHLHALAQIQSETGREIVQESHRDAAGVSVITSLMIAVAVIIGILIQSLIQNARFRERNAAEINSY